MEQCSYNIRHFVLRPWKQRGWCGPHDIREHTIIILSLKGLVRITLSGGFSEKCTQYINCPCIPCLLPLKCPYWLTQRSCGCPISGNVRGLMVFEFPSNPNHSMAQLQKPSLKLFVGEKSIVISVLRFCGWNFLPNMSGCEETAAPTAAFQQNSHYVLYVFMFA